ncbi:MAG TPA: acetaldehyde dehydrogenase (acetylating) [Candidatus Omnitrophota bacterium]|nr:acetaldehyde dehydrogenase (acetylating) [Candidatus Omnitrophota bacterium]HPD85574.1 acetaldehyde dehydrogenase (acetylating) [Candidatus Omnitrophota bacterium]HRZ04386.1 acetaldehyde dehydrogenase (acetylating) [Candidatus Omnitrophota bacterium]
MAQYPEKIKVAILGSGNIGTDLLIKILRSDVLECTRFVGRNCHSKGMLKAKEKGVAVSDKGINEILDNPDCCRIVFDATSAKDHLQHWALLKETDKTVIDMTPSKIGKMIVPAINLDDALDNRNVNMVSCGGQASIPLAFVLSRTCKDIEYIEVVSSIASRSAGMATRINIDEYIENTEEGLRSFTRCDNVKVILILNPADPCIDMQTTLSAKMPKPDIEKLRAAVFEMERAIQAYVPGYSVIVPPVYENNRIVIMVKVRGLGDYLPAYAGNLDIINCAAVRTAERYACRMQDALVGAKHL